MDTELVSVVGILVFPLATMFFPHCCDTSFVSACCHVSLGGHCWVRNKLSIISSDWKFLNRNDPVCPLPPFLYRPRTAPSSGEGLHWRPWWFTIAAPNQTKAGNPGKQPCVWVPGAVGPSLSLPESISDWTAGKIYNVTQLPSSLFTEAWEKLFAK